MRRVDDERHVVAVSIRRTRAVGFLRVSTWEILVSLATLVAPVLASISVKRGKAEQEALTFIEPKVLVTPLLVVIPARNEATRIGDTLDQLLCEPSPHLRVIVVDDGSTDNTADVVRQRIARDGRLSLRQPAAPRPAGWFGKPAALHDGIGSDEEHELILCLDADVHLQPGALGGFVGALGDADALSAMPRLHNVGVVENALVPAFVAAVGVTHPPSEVHNPRSTTAFLNGQLMLLRRSALDEVGGFAAVATTVLEDVALARLLKSRGKKLRIVDGRRVCSTRMYTSLAEILEGFGKNARALHGSELVPLAMVLATVAWLPWLVLVLAWLTDGAFDDVMAMGCLEISIACAFINRKLLWSPSWLAVLSPLVQAVVAAVYFRAAVVRRGSWKGRTFST